MSTPKISTSRSYTDDVGLANRANSAMLAIAATIENRNLPSGMRLALIAEIMAEEPILTDPAPAAYRARAEARRYLKSILESNERRRLS